MKDLGDSHLFLGMDVERDHEQSLFYINQIGISRRFSSIFTWRIAKPLECHLIPRPS